MSDTIEAALRELVVVTSGDSDGWALRVVERAGFAHIDASLLQPTVGCAGYTMLSNGRAFCGWCNWQLSARLEDVGEERSARFALFALAAVGEAVGSILRVLRVEFYPELRKLFSDAEIARTHLACAAGSDELVVIGPEHLDDDPREA